MSAITDLARAVTAELNDPAGPLAGQAEAVMAYRPVYDLQDMKHLHVTVVPRAVEMAAASRERVQADLRIDIGVQRKVDPEDPPAVEALLSLVEQIADYLRDRRPADMPQAAWVSTQNEPVYALEHLDQLRQFTSVLTVTYRLMR